MSETRGSKLGESFGQVFRDELACLRERWKTVYREGGNAREAPSDTPTVDNELVGLAFSGGGIRSATINMGIAQALHRRGVFDHVDYMSTVSGGGYLGSGISTAMRRLGPEGQGEFPYELPSELTTEHPESKAPAGDTAVGEPREVESRFLTWVRNNSNYMATGGFLDWPRIFGVLLRGILVNFLVLLPILLVLAVALVWRHGDILAVWEKADQAAAAAQSEVLTAAEIAERAERRATGGDAAAWAAADQARASARRATEAAEGMEEKGAEARSAGTLFLATAGFAGLFLLLVLSFPVLVRVYIVHRHKVVVETGEESSVHSRGLIEKVFGGVLVLIFVAAALEALPLLIRWFHQVETSGLRGLYAGAASGGALAILTGAGKVLSKLGGLRQKLALLLVGLLGLVIPLVVALYVADDLIYPVAGVEAGADPTPAYRVTAYQAKEFAEWPSGRDAVRLLPGILLLIMGGGVGAAAVGRLMKRSRVRAIFTVLGIAAGAFVGYALLIAASKLLAMVSGAMGLSGIRPDVLVLAMAAVVCFFCWVAVNVNLTAVLGLYRDRLASAYLIGLRKKKDRRGAETGEREIFVEPDLDLEELCGGLAGSGKAAACLPSKAPYHILNTALNLQGSDDPMLRDRGSDFFMFSKLYYGGHRTGYCRTGLLEKVFPQMDLSTAMAISAAAASPNAGRVTSKPLVALLTLLNVRLGYWVPHPGRLFDWLKKKRIADPKLRHRWGWRIPPWALLREMASAVNETNKWVNLSDGGHLENTAAYELLRRRCKYVICGDGEADPTLAFNGLATLMRAARIDMGIEIEILLDDLRLGDDRASYQHAALGRIKYPPRTQGGEDEEGWLLYLKSSFTGNEDETIQEYRATNPDFPHESTADQFFDEGQFEAYRALGFHIADGLFPPRGKGDPGLDWDGFKLWFHKLRADLAPRLSAKHVSLQKQLRRISKLLRREEYRAYFYELYPKLDTRREEEKEADDENRARGPAIAHLIGLQLDLMESAFLSLHLDQPVNWNHPGNQGWRGLFEAWAGSSEDFRVTYCLLRHLRSGRFQNFCERNLSLPSEEACETLFSSRAPA